jgi:hypothetical protein
VSIALREWMIRAAARDNEAFVRFDGTFVSWQPFPGVATMRKAWMRHCTDCLE